MTASTKVLKKEVKELREEVDFLKEVIKEDYELSDEAKKGLEKARSTPISEYTDLE